MIGPTVQEAAVTPTMIVDVADDGPGVPAELSDRIFDPFFTSKETGTGLGLTIVHRIVENYNGKIFLRSDVQTGTTFTLHFPLSGEDGPPEPPAQPLPLD